MTAKVFGWFDPLGFVTRLNGYRQSEIAEIVALIDEGKTSSAAGRSYGPFGTLLHEGVHCLQIASTPFGHFWTRALLAQTLFVSLLFRGLFKAAPGTEIWLPLDRCWSGIDTLTRALDVARRRWNDIDDLLGTLVSPAEMPIEDACRVHRSALRAVFDYGYLDRQEQPQLAADAPELASGVAGFNAIPANSLSLISTSNLVEAHARILENQFLRSQEDWAAAELTNQQSDAAKDTIALQVLAMIHDERYEYSTEMIQTVLALVDLALFAPLDPALEPLWSRTLLWEDLHPAYRYLHAANLTKEIGFLARMEDFESYQTEICMRAGWYTPREIIEALRPRLTPPKTPYDRFFLTCLAHRLEQPDAFASGAAADAGFIAPITLYDDQIGLNMTRLLPPEPGNETIFRLLEASAVREIARQFLFESTFESPEVVRRCNLDLQKIIAANFQVTLRDKGPVQNA
jgi:hypothetical protein